MGIYKQIKDANDRKGTGETWVLPGELKGKDLKGCTEPGAQIMKSLQQQTFEKLFAAFVAYGANNKWEWHGQGGSNPVGLLDGTKLIGECLHFVTNLQTLAKAPAPFGLGLAAMDLATHSGDPVLKCGFVAKHVGNPLALAANVVSPGKVRTISELYLWDNHKVLFHDAKYWDPSYSRTYANLADMEAFRLSENANGIRLDGKAGTIESFNDGQNFFPATQGKAKFLFRRLKPSESINQSLTYEGPLIDTRGLFNK